MIQEAIRNDHRKIMVEETEQYYSFIVHKSARYLDIY